MKQKIIVGVSFNEKFLIKSKINGTIIDHYQETEKYMCAVLTQLAVLRNLAKKIKRKIKLHVQGGETIVK